MSDPRDPESGANDETSDPAGPTEFTGFGEDVGSVEEEAAKLLGALSKWARYSSGREGGLGGDAGAGLGETLSGLVDHAATTVSEINAHVATGSAECSYCPLCRTVHVIRQTRPEVKEHLAVAASSFLQAVVGLLATVPPGSDQESGSGVERIDLDDEGDEGDEDGLT